MHDDLWGETHQHADEGKDAQAHPFAGQKIGAGVGFAPREDPRPDAQEPDRIERGDEHEPGGERRVWDEQPLRDDVLGDEGETPWEAHRQDAECERPKGEQRRRHRQTVVAVQGHRAAP